MTSFGSNWFSGSGEKDENVENDDDGQRTKYDKKSSLEPKAQKVKMVK